MFICWQHNSLLWYYPLDAIEKAPTGKWWSLPELKFVKQGHCHMCKKATTSVCSACQSHSTLAETRPGRDRRSALLNTRTNQVRVPWGLKELYSPYWQFFLHTTTAVSSSCRLHGSMSTHFPNSFIPSGKIRRNENESRGKSQHTVNLEEDIGKSWFSHSTTRRETVGMDANHSKSILCFYSWRETWTTT